MFFSSVFKDFLWVEQLNSMRFDEEKKERKENNCMAIDRVHIYYHRVNNTISIHNKKLIKF